MEIAIMSHVYGARSMSQNEGRQGRWLQALDLSTDSAPFEGGEAGSGRSKRGEQPRRVRGDSASRMPVKKCS